jgi:hypothetical protein
VPNVRNPSRTRIDGQWGTHTSCRHIQFRREQRAEQNRAGRWAACGLAWTDRHPAQSRMVREPSAVVDRAIRNLGLIQPSTELRTRRAPKDRLHNVLKLRLVLDPLDV